MANSDDGGPGAWAGIVVAGFGLIGTIWRLAYTRPRRKFSPDPKQTWQQALNLIDRQRDRIKELEREVDRLEKALRNPPIYPPE
jgi:hypothetical protein